jgi:hypothetical protein
MWLAHRTSCIVKYYWIIILVAQHQSHNKLGGSLTNQPVSNFVGTFPTLVDMALKMDTRSWNRLNMMGMCSFVIH